MYDPDGNGSMITFEKAKHEDARALARMQTVVIDDDSRKFSPNKCGGGGRKRGQ